MVAFPLMVRDRVIGVLAAYHVEPDHFTPAHQRILERVSAQAAKVVLDALVFEQIRIGIADRPADGPRQHAQRSSRTPSTRWPRPTATAPGAP